MVIGRDELDAAAQPDALGALLGCRQDLKRNSTLQDTQRTDAWGSDADDFDRGEVREVGVLGYHRGSVTHRRGCDPGVMAAKLATLSELLIRDPRETRSGGNVDLEQRIFRPHARERRHSRGPRGPVLRAEHAELELRSGHDGYRDLVWQVPQRSPCLARDEDGRIGDRAAHRSSISEPRTSAKSSRSRASAPASSTILRSVSEWTQGLRVALWGTMSATGSRLTVSERRLPRADRRYDVGGVVSQLPNGDLASHGH